MSNLRRFLGAIICCLFVLIINDNNKFKVLGQAEGKRVTLKCSDHQNVDENKLNELCKGRNVQKCVLAGNRIDGNDEIYHPSYSNQKHCLIFQRSSINKLPVEFFTTYTSLRYIDLSNSRLESIDNYTFSIETLIELNLSENELAFLLADAFNGARNLKILDLSHNSISVINPNIFTSLHSLIELNLSNNKLHNESFSSQGDINISLEGLKKLDLSHNRIFYDQVMPYQSFAGLKSLEVLKLQHNNITLDYGVFASNQHLKTLDISFNSFPYFELDFLLSVQSLQHLYLNGNGISYASQIDLSDVRSSFPSLSSIGISKNSFACEVLASMIRKFDKAKIELVVEREDFVGDARNLRGIKCI